MRLSNRARLILKISFKLGSLRSTAGGKILSVSMRPLACSPKGAFKLTPSDESKRLMLAVQKVKRQKINLLRAQVGITFFGRLSSSVESSDLMSAMS